MRAVRVGRNEPHGHFCRALTVLSIDEFKSNAGVEKYQGSQARLFSSRSSMGALQNSVE